MADQANNFGPLTPEQEAELRRQGISTEGLSPLDLLGGAGLGAGVARLGQHMAGAVGRVPWYQSALGMMGGAAAGAGMGANMPGIRAQ